MSRSLRWLPVVVALGACGEPESRPPDGGIVVFLGDGHGGLGAPTVYRADTSRTLLAWDFDDDSHLDLAAVANNSGRLHVLYGLGGGAFEVGDDVVPDVVATDAVLADLDGDGRTEIITVSEDRVEVLTIRGRRVTARQQTPALAFALRIATGDVNGDGAADIAYSTLGGSAQWLVGDGAGHLSAELPVSMLDSGAFRLLASDLDADGRDDLVALTGLFELSGGHDGIASVLMSGGPSASQRVDYLAAESATAAAVFDANGDGTRDMVVGDLSSQRLWFRAGDGTGHFGDVVSSEIPSDPFALCNGDLDGNGIQDLVGVDYDRSTVNVMLGTGQGTFESQPAVDAVLEPWSLLCADFDGDGNLDVAISSSGSYRQVQ